MSKESKLFILDYMYYYLSFNCWCFVPLERHLHGQRVLLRRGHVLAVRQLPHAQGGPGIIAHCGTGKSTGKKLSEGSFINEMCLKRFVVLQCSGEKI
jgi:hypothetical protein